jgi:hypothetical protein
MLQKELEEKEKVLNQRSTRKKGKRIVLRDVVVCVCVCVLVFNGRGL